MTFVVVDYSKGNLRSVQKCLELAGAEVCISSRVADIKAAEGIVVPGVGSFADASKEMLASGQMQAIRNRVNAGIPFLGICLGMQLLFEWGNEGMEEGCWAEGLGILKGRCVRIAERDSTGVPYKVPHVGWNEVHYVPDALGSPALSQLFADTDDNSHFYFTHSYGCELNDSADLLATTIHAGSIPSAVGREKVFGVQFHPEKSSHKGLKIMSNFVQLAKNMREMK